MSWGYLLMPSTTVGFSHLLPQASVIVALGHSEAVHLVCGVCSHSSHKSLFVHKWLCWPNGGLVDYELLYRHLHCCTSPPVRQQINTASHSVLMGLSWLANRPGRAATLSMTPPVIDGVWPGAIVGPHRLDTGRIYNTAPLTIHVNP